MIKRQSADRDLAEQSGHESGRGSGRAALCRTLAEAIREEGMLNRLEAAIRCYDPCLSCSTHALGQMPMIVEIIAPDGSTKQIVRD